MRYPPAYYVDNDLEFTNRIIENHGFCLLTCPSEIGPLATHLPMIKAENNLYGHVAGNNPMVDFIGTELVFLAVFHGAHDYISPTLYDDPSRSVPTWDYVSVHIHGTTRALSAEESVDQMHNLIDKYEGEAGWYMEDAAEYASQLFPNIVAFEMQMDRVTGLRKLSQNKNAETQSRIIDDLRARGNVDLAKEIDMIRKR